MARLVSIIIIIAIVIVVIFGLRLIMDNNKASADPNQPIKTNPNNNSEYADLILPFETVPVQPTEYADLPSHWLETIYNWHTKKISLIYDGEVLDTQIDVAGAVIDKNDQIEKMANEDGSVQLIKIGDYTYSLYCVYRGTVFKLADEVNRHWLSRDGETAYVHQEGILYSYALMFNERSIVRAVNEIYRFELSPDGKHVLFNGSQGMSYYHDKDVTEIWKNCEARAATNQGGIYFYDADDEGLFYMAGPEGEKIKIAPGEEMNVMVRNYDNTQFIFDDRYERNKSKLLYVEEGDLTAHFIAEVIEVIENYDSSASYAPSAAWVPIGPILPEGYNWWVEVSAYAIKNLKGMLYYEYGNVWHLSDSLESTLLLTQPARRIGLANDGNTMLYTVSDTLYLMRLDEGGKHTEIASDIEVKKFRVTDDGQTLYFVSRDNVLYYVQSNNRPAKIADSVRVFEFSPKDNTLFYKVKDTLYAITDGTGVEIVSDNVELFWVYPSHAMFMTKAGRDTDDEYDFYVRNPGEEFTRVFERIPKPSISGPSRALS